MIQNLVVAGCHSVKQIQKDLEMYVKSDLGVGEGRSTNRFLPKPQDIRNHIYNAPRFARCSEDDQTSVSAMVDTWRSKYPRDRFFFRPASVNQSGEVESFLFVHQTELQQRLLRKYGLNVVIMDVTYKTTNNDIPLILLCVSQRDKRRRILPDWSGDNTTNKRCLPCRCCHCGILPGFPPIS